MTIVKICDTFYVFMKSKPFEGDYFVTSNFGNRIHPVTGVTSFHRGVDFNTPVGTTLYAVENGFILRATQDQYGGKFIDLQAGSGKMYRYLHLDSFDVRTNQRVRISQQIGTSGNSGLSTGPHLHFEEALTQDGVRVNPLQSLFSTAVNPSQMQAEMSAIQKLNRVKQVLEDWFKQNANRGYPNDDGNTFGYLRGLLNGSEDESLQIILNDYSKAFNQKNELRQQNKELKRNLSDLDEDVEDLEQIVRDLQQELAAVKNERNGLKQEVDRAMMQFNNLNAKIKRLEEQNGVQVDPNWLDQQIKNLDFLLQDNVERVSKMISSENYDAFILDNLRQALQILNRIRTEVL